MLKVEVDYLSLCEGELCMKEVNLALERGDGSNTAIHRISHPCVCFVDQTAHGVAPLHHRQLLQDIFTTANGSASEEENGVRNLQELADITGSEDLVHSCKLLWLICREVRCKYAILHTSPPQQLARRTWRHSCTTTDLLPD